MSYQHREVDYAAPEYRDLLKEQLDEADWGTNQLLSEEDPTKKKAFCNYLHYEGICRNVKCVYSHHPHVYFHTMFINRLDPNSLWMLNPTFQKWAIKHAYKYGEAGTTLLRVVLANPTPQNTEFVATFQRRVHARIQENENENIRKIRADILNEAVNARAQNEVIENFNIQPRTDIELMPTITSSALTVANAVTHTFTPPTLEEYLDFCKDILEEMSTCSVCTAAPVAAVKCETKGCEKFLCTTCYRSHLRNLRTKKHNFSVYCPVCGTFFPELKNCQLCEVSTGGRFCCAICQVDTHNSLSHAYSANNNFAFLQLYCSQVAPSDTAPSPSPSTPIPAISAEDDFTLSPEEYGVWNIVRCRSLVEDVAQPMVIALWKVEWSRRPSPCTCPNSNHSFDDIKSSCLIGLLPASSLLSDPACKSAKKCLEVSDLDNRGIECLQRNFDLGVICLFISLWYDLHSTKSIPPIVRKQDLLNLRNWRNACFHNTAMDDGMFRVTFDGIVNICYLIKNSIDRNNLGCDSHELNKLQDKIRTCEQSLSRPSLWRLFQNQILLESQRAFSDGMTKHLRSPFASTAGPNTLPMGEWLCSLSKGMRVLVIPKFGAGTNFEAIQGTADFLKRIPWTVILDMNASPLWSLDSNFSLECTNVPSDTKSFGYSRTLYTNSLREVVKLTQSGKSTTVAVMGFGDISFEKQDLDDLKTVLYMITDAKGLIKSNDLIDVRPIVDDINFLVATNLLWSLSDHREIVEAASQSVLSLTLLASYVYGHLRPLSTLLLPASNTNGSIMGMPTKSFNPFAAYLDILTIDCDALPWHVPLTHLDEDEIDSNEIVDRELLMYLSYKTPSWYLFKHGKVVTRDLVDTLVNTIRDKKVITLEHDLRAGVSTICRHALYLLRREYICVVVKDEFQASNSEKVAKFLKEISSVANLKVLILLDFKRFSGDARKSVFRDALEHEGSRFWVLLQTRNNCYVVDANPKGERILRVKWDLSQKEAKAFRALLPKLRMITLGSYDWSKYLTEHGFLDVASMKEKAPDLIKRICRHSDSALLSSGFWPSDIQAIRCEAQFNYPLDGVSNVMSLGLMGFLPELYEQAEKYVKELLKGVDREIPLLKLLVFYALFAPARGLPIKVAGYVLEGDIYAHGNVKLSSIVQFFVDMDTRYDTVRIKTPQLAYILADSKEIFGPREDWGENVGLYVRKELLPLITSDEARTRDFAACVGDAMVDMFASFRVWHPEETKKKNVMNRNLTYSYLIEFLLNASKNEDGGKTRSLARRRVIDTAKNIAELYVGRLEHCVLVTQTERLMTNIAYTLHKEGHTQCALNLIDEAKNLLYSIANGNTIATVSDRFGNLFKTKLRILGSMFYKQKNETDEMFARRGASMSTSMSIDTFNDLLNIAKSADEYFRRAIEQSSCLVPNPFIAAVQVFECLLSIVKNGIYSGDAAKLYSHYLRMDQNMLRNKQYAIQQLRNLDVFDRSYDYLMLARSAMKYVSSKSLVFNYEFTSIVGNRSTTDLIKELTRALGIFAGEERLRLRDAPVCLDLTHARRLWLSGKLNCEQLVFCMLSCANHILTKGPRQMKYSSLDLFVKVSIALSAESTAQDMVCQFQSSIKNDLSKTWTTNLESLLDQWVRIADSELCHESLPPRIGRVLYYVWKCFFRISDDNTDTMNALKNALISLFTSGQNFRNRHETRYFLQSKCSINENPFSCFRASEDLDFADDLQQVEVGDFTAREHIFAACGHNVLQGIVGEIAVNDSKHKSIRCKDLHSIDIFINKHIAKDLEVGQKVSFFLGLCDSGLKAHGVCRVE